jgi:hypothetical protein
LSDRVRNGPNGQTHVLPQEAPMSGRKRVKNTRQVVYIERWPGPWGVPGGRGAGGRAARGWWRAPCQPRPVPRAPARGRGRGAGGSQADGRPGPGQTRRVAGDGVWCSPPSPHGGAGTGRHGHGGVPAGRVALVAGTSGDRGRVAGGPACGELLRAGRANGPLLVAVVKQVAGLCCCFFVVIKVSLSPCAGWRGAHCVLCRQA